MKVKSMIWLVLTASGIIMLWFILGVLSPLVFGGLGYSGQFGDSFGAVNALFTGFGFLGLTYTIYLQIQANIDQKKKDEFNVHLRLYDDLKNDIEKIEWQNHKGINCITQITRQINEGDIRSDYVSMEDTFLYLYSIYTQFKFLILIGKFEKEREQLDTLLYFKTANLYLSTMHNLSKAIIFRDNSTRNYNRLKELTIVVNTDMMKLVNKENR